MIELADHGAIGALSREGTDMGFNQDGFLPRAPAPIGRAPSIACVIDQLARTRNVVGLKGGSRVGHVDLVVEPKFIVRTGPHARNVSEKPAVLTAPHRLGFFEQQIDPLRARRPKSKRGAVRCQSCAELPLIHAEPAKARTERGGAFSSSPDAEFLTCCLTSTVFNSCRHILYSGIFGNLNAISSVAAFNTMKIGSPPLWVGPST